MEKIKIVLATKNKGKLKEFSAMMPDYVELISQTDAGVSGQAEENADTYAGNSALKAEFVFKATGLPSLADDSGLECEAIEGRPGVYSARFAGEGATDIDNNTKLLKELHGKADRRARFVSHLCLITSKGRYDFEGYLYGHITDTPRGDNGFGYDPIFIPEGETQTIAELPDEKKNSISHRHKALEAFLKGIGDVEW